MAHDFAAALSASLEGFGVTAAGFGDLRVRFLPPSIALRFTGALAGMTGGGLLTRAPRPRRRIDSASDASFFCFGERSVLLGDFARSRAVAWRSVSQLIGRSVFFVRWRLSRVNSAHIREQRLCADWSNAGTATSVSLERPHGQRASP